MNISSDTTVSLNPNLLHNPNSRSSVRVKRLQAVETGNVRVNSRERVKLQDRNGCLLLMARSVF